MDQTRTGMQSDHSLAFGTLLRRARRAAGLTQEAVAERAGVSVRTVSDLERGVNHAPHTDTVVLLAEALGLQGTESAAFVVAASRLRTSASPARVPASGAGEGSTAPFVGRQRELALLERHLAGQGPPLLLLAGEPGIGKTRLLQAVATRALGRGLAVLEGGCQRRGGQEPYAPLLGALKGYLRRQTPRQQRAALRGCAWLVRLLPELAEGPIEPLPTWTLPPEQEHRLMFEAVARFLTNVAEQGMGGGVLLLLDDLQWAGPDAFNLLGTLVRSAGDLSLRLIGAYRDTEVGRQDPLSVALADLAPAGLATRRLVSPLTSEEAEHLLSLLLEGTCDERPVPRERMLQRTGGVPFFLVSCAQALRGRDTDQGEDAVPWDVRQSVQQRVVALPVAVQDVLGAAAVAGREVAHALLAGVVARPEDEVLAAFDAACRGRLLEELGAQTFQFAHDVIREVVEGDLGAARRMMLHRRIAEALERQPGERRMEQLAHHYERGGVQDKSVLYQEQAGDRALAQYAYASAESFYAAAADGREQLGQQLESARVRAKAGIALQQMGRYDAAQVTLERAAVAFRAGGDREQMVHIVAEIARHYYYRGRPEEGLCWLEPQMPVMEAAATADLPRRALAPLYQALGYLYRSLGRYTEAVEMTALSVDLVRGSDAGTALATALYRHAFMLIDIVGRIDDMYDLAVEAMRVAEAADDLNGLNWALYLLAYPHCIRGEWVPCQTYLGRALEGEARRRNPGPLLDLVRSQGIAAFYMGDWARARQEFERARDVSHQMGAAYPYGNTPILLHLARLELAEGQWELAARSCTEALGLARSAGAAPDHLDTYEQLAELDLRVRMISPHWAASPSALELLAELDLLAGRAQEAHARLALVRDRPGVEERGVTPLLVLLAWAHLDLGENVEAQEVIADALRRLRIDDDRLGLVDALRVQAMVHTGCGRWREAAASLEEGRTLARAMPYPYGEARLLQAYGTLLAREGERKLARERLEAALAIFQRLGARKDLERAEELLTALG